AASSGSSTWRWVRMVPTSPRDTGPVMARSPCRSALSSAAESSGATSRSAGCTPAASRVSTQSRTSVTRWFAPWASAANHLVTLVRDCVDTLEAAGVHPADRLVAPLLSAALDNALRHGDRAITGPVSRGDVGTIRTHLQVLDPELAAAYRVLAVRSAHRAAAAGLLSEHALKDVLTTLEESP